MLRCPEFCAAKHWRAPMRTWTCSPFPRKPILSANVVLEALASGVPAVVTAAGGPKYLVEPGVTGFVAANPRAFTACVLEIMRDPLLHARMRAAARESALRRSWDGMFETEVYGAYRACLEHSLRAGPGPEGTPEGAGPKGGTPPQFAGTWYTA